MTTSGQTDFNPNLADLMLEAFERIQIRPSEILAEHLFSARMSANLILLVWGTRGVNLWAVDRQTLPMIQGVATYDLPADTVQLLDNVRQLASGGQTQEIVLTPLSRTDYNAIPSKDQQAPPTSYWFNRQSPIPSVTFWPAPDAVPYNFVYFRMRQIQSANMVASETVDLPNRFIEAFLAEWAFRLAVKWRPAQSDKLQKLAVFEWSLASDDDSERVSTFMRPDFSGYMG